MAHQTAYSRTVDGRTFELVNTAEDCTAFRDGELLFRCPKGVRVVTDRQGNTQSLIGMSVNSVHGEIETAYGRVEFRAAANEQLDLKAEGLVSVRSPGFTPPGT